MTNPVRLACVAVWILLGDVRPRFLEGLAS
jgi:hypothetical protein